MAFPSAAAAAAAAVAANEDLTSEILSWLPAKSVVRFRSVCRRWLSLTSEPFFITNHTHRNSQAICGHILGTNFPLGSIFHYYGCIYTCVSLDGNSSGLLDNILGLLPVPSSLSSIKHLAHDGKSAGFRILLSACGLIFCGSGTHDSLSDSNTTYYMCNLITMQCKQIPRPASRYIAGFGIGLAPRSPHYRIVCLGSSKIILKPNEQIEMYSSEKGTWELFPGLVDGRSTNNCYIYCEGEINWVTRRGSLVAFDIERQRVRTTTLPPVPQGSYRRVLDLCSSGGRLHLIQSHINLGAPLDIDQDLCFDIFVIGKERSGWDLIYHVDLTTMREFYNSFLVCHLGGDDTLFIAVQEKIMSYNLKSKTLQVICPYDNWLRSLLPYSLTFLSP